MNSPHEHFIDESIIAPTGVPIEYTPTFGREHHGIEVKEATWEEFIQAREAMK